jgi:hypothetical protein
MDGEVSEISFLPYFPDVIAQGQPQTFLKTGAHYAIPLPANRRQDLKFGVFNGKQWQHIPTKSVYLDIPVNRISRMGISKKKCDMFQCINYI